ncbi:MAG: hypothetical protein IT536_08600 [Hyphomicrobiales bacterium]|nr:hypothetical protein [Hyphomicrobiales bacterium]
MPGEPLTLSAPAAAPFAQSDYEAIGAALTATARGRWFLDEFARRIRNADTAPLLEAVARLEAAVASDRAERAHRAAGDAVRIELLEMARAIAQARAEVGAGTPARVAGAAVEGGLTPDLAGAAERLRQVAWTLRAVGLDAPACEDITQILDTIMRVDAARRLDSQRVQMLSEALLYLEHRIERMLDGGPAATTNSEVPAAALVQNKAPDNAHGEAQNNAHDNAYEPSPARPADAIAVQVDGDLDALDGNAADDTTRCAVDLRAGAKQSSDESRVRVAAGEAGSPPARGRVEMEPTPARAELARVPADAASTHDPLASLMALSEEERIALFS